MSLLLPLLRERRRTIGLILALSAIEALPIVALGKFLALGLDHGFLRGRPVIGFGWLSALLGTIILAAAAARTMHDRLSTVVDGVWDDLLRRVVESGLKGPGRAVDLNLVEEVRQSLSALLWTFRRAAIAIAATVVGVILVAPIIGLVVAPPVVVAVLLSGALLPRLVARQRAVVLAEEAVGHDAAGTIRGLRDIIACQAADRAAADLAAVVDAEAMAAREFGRISALRVLVVAFGAQVPLVVLIGLGPHLIHSGQLSVGALVATAGYLIGTLQPTLRSLVQVAGDRLLRLAVALTRLAETTVTPAEATSGSATPPGYALSCARLTFTYGPEADPVFRDLDLTLAEGEYLAVVGPSGAGKSTLADLICGLIRPQRGEIRLDGVLLEDWDRTLLHSRVALVTPAPYVFTGTVAENVGYPNPSVDLVAAADAVDLWPLLDRLGGWDSEICRSSLTAGERQLIALARAYASPARLVILDDATGHLDRQQAQFVEQSFRDRAGSLIVIAPDAESARRADRILVLDGRSVALGRHEELVTTSPLYARLASRPEPALAAGDQSAL